MTEASPGSDTGSMSENSMSESSIPENSEPAIRSTPIRVLFVEYALGFGGSLVGLAEWVKSLRGHIDPASPVVTFAPPTVTDPLFPEHTTLRAERPLNYASREQYLERIDAHGVLRLLKFALIRLFNLRMAMQDRGIARRLRDIAVERNVDLVHLNNGVEMSGAWAAREAGVPCIVHHRGFMLPEINPRSQWDHAWFHDVVRKHIGMAEGISASVEAIGVPPTSVCTIVDPVVVDDYVCPPALRSSVRAAWDIRNSEFVVGVYGRIVDWKGQAEFLEGMAAVMELCPNVRILLVGDGDANDPYTSRVKEIARRPEFGNRVIFTGFQSDMRAYYGASDLVVHCSTTPEPFGRVVVEGWAAAKPVIGMNEGGPVEIITDGEDGVLVEPRDPSALGQAVAALYADRERCDRLARAGYDRVRAEYAPDVVAKKMMAVYGEVLRREL